jgi:hypothetical protein
MIRNSIQVLSLATVLLSSFFLIKSVITLSVKDIIELSVPKYDYNLDVAKNLCRQRADTIIGFTLLLLSFLLQLINMLWPMRINDFAVSKMGVAIAILAAILILLISGKTANSIYIRSFKQVEFLLKK